MMNYIWVGMLLIGIGFSIFNGRLGAFSDNLMVSCTEAVQFVIVLSGIMAVWSGLMNIAEKSGLIDLVAKKVMPLMKILFPKKLKKETITMILMSFTANMFGAGNSATVFSLKAMEMLDEENNHSYIASDAMCMFIAVNMTMIQLVPITVMKIRNQLGSIDSASIIIPSIIVHTCAMIASILICKYYERKANHVRNS